VEEVAALVAVAMGDIIITLLLKIGNFRGLGGDSGIPAHRHLVRSTP
jgi:hypothetical protein